MFLSKEYKLSIKALSLLIFSDDVFFSSAMSSARVLIVFIVSLSHFAIGSDSIAERTAVDGGIFALYMAGRSGRRVVQRFGTQRVGFCDPLFVWCVRSGSA